MYQQILAIKKGEKYNNKDQMTARHIRFSIDENPLVSPLKKAQIQADRDNPRNKREYYNRW
jgi:hypothetical protein